jgi:hypothetical protein
MARLATALKNMRKATRNKPRLKFCNLPIRACIGAAPPYDDADCFLHAISGGPMHRFFISASAAAFILFFLIRGASPAGDKAAPWQPFLPVEEQKVLASRSLEAIMELSKAGNKTRAEVEEAILAGYALSVERKSGDSKEANRREDIAKLKGKMQRKELFVDMMEIFRNKAKRGDGIHAELQYQPKLKNQNGIEALIGALAGKKLSEENLAKVEKELPLLSYRIAVMANLTQHAAPAKDTDRWIKLASDMRDSALALAKSAKKKDANGILKAADALQDSCITCHREFKTQ